MRILFIAPRFPYPPSKGDTLRMYHQIRALSRVHEGRNAEITLLSIADVPVGRDDLAHLASLCAHVEIVPLPGWRVGVNVARGAFVHRPLQVSYYHLAAFQDKLDEVLAGGNFDVLHVTSIKMVPYVWKRHDIPIVVDLIDSLGLNLDIRRKSARGLRHIANEIEYQRVLDYERSVVERFPALVVSSPADKQMLGGRQISVIPNGVDLERFPFQKQEGRDPGTVIFTGNFAYEPNEEAVVWFLGEVWPKLQGKRPELRFQIVGTNPTAGVVAAAIQAKNVEIVEVAGHAEDIATYLGKAAIAVCPMHSGSGIQSKVLEAMSTGTPVVATRMADRGIGGQSNHHLLLADTAPHFVYELERLLSDELLRVRLAEAGRALVEERFRWEDHADKLLRLYEAQVATNRPPAGREREIADEQSPPEELRTRHSSQAHKVETRINVMQMIDVTGRGGAEKALVDIALRLDRSRYNVAVCATRSAGNYQPLLDASGVTTFVQGRNSRWDFGQWLKLVRLMRREHVDVLHTHLFGSNTLGRLLGRLGGVRVIIAHEHWSTKAKREVWVDRALYRLSDRILVPSAASKAMVMRTEGVPSDCIEVLYNGVDTAQFTQGHDRTAARAEFGIPADAMVIGIVGRLSEEKGGVDHLIRAVGRLYRDNPSIRLLIVGDGPLRPELESLAAGAATPGAISFTGTRSDVARLMNAMDIFVLPSLNEALPIVVLEAMAVGLPVVATRVGGLPEIIEDGQTGLLIAPGSEDTIHAALQRLISTPSLREKLAREGRALVTASFTIGQMVERVQSLYEDLLAHKQNASRRLR